MTRRKREIVGLRNELDYPHVVELALPLGPFRSVFLEIDAFHSPPRPESTRGQASLYSILLPRDRYGGCIPQSLRWRVLDPHTGQAQAADLGYVVGCTGLTREEDWGSGGAGMLVFQRRPRRVDVVPAWLNGGDRADRLPPTRRARRCGARTGSGKPCRSPATKKGRCRLHGGASGSGGPAGVRNGQYRHGERTKAAIAERQKFSALLKMLRAGLT
jgi:hypothetical protein